MMKIQNDELFYYRPDYEKVLIDDEQTKWPPHYPFGWKNDRGHHWA